MRICASCFIFLIALLAQRYCPDSIANPEQTIRVVGKGVTIVKAPKNTVVNPATDKAALLILRYYYAYGSEYVYDADC